MATKKATNAMKATSKSSSPASRPASASSRSGGETHQTAAESGVQLTTNQGLVVSDNQNSLKLGARGPTLLEDLVLREKITHFDHERIPERIVHARGSAAHGFFQPYPNAAKHSKAALFANPRKKTEVFTRFSTVVGGAGSADLHRDVRGFAVKFYTDEGNFDLVGNNIPVFFIQDAMKFPDLVHAVKMEPDRGFPVAGSAHDTFWDFASLMPETMHMLMWAMSDRAIPRSYRMMEGFGVHTFRLIDANDNASFVKFHWRPLLGAQSVVWDEAVKINGADPEFHRRDLFEAIAGGDFPEYELSIQKFPEDILEEFGLDVLDATKLVPEELVPLEPIGKMTLDRNPTNFFAETEQVAFHPGHIVPGIDFSNDPLLQGRLFSYLDTQLKRLGTPNFHEIPINRPRCPFRNFQRDAQMRTTVPEGRVSYEPNSLEPKTAREDPRAGFRTVTASDDDLRKVRERSPSFSDHYSQARMFFRSMSEPEQRHIILAFSFELAKVETPAVRTRMLGHLQIIDSLLGDAVADQLAMKPDRIAPKRAPLDLDESPTLSLIKKAKPTLQGRKVAVLVSDGTDAAFVDKLRAALTKEGARLAVIAPKIGGAKAKGGGIIAADHALSGAPSVLFDHVVIAPSAQGAAELALEAAAIDFVRDAFGHLKVIGHLKEAQPLLDKAAVVPDTGVVVLSTDVASFVKIARNGRIWDREPTLRSPR